MSNTHGTAERLLHTLLDRYESSKAFAAGEETARRVQVTITDRLITGYVSGGMDPDDRRSFHRTLGMWAAEGIIGLDWVRFEVGNLLRRVILEWNGVDKAYSILGRTPRIDELSALRKELLVWRSQLVEPWMQRWLDDVLHSMDERKALPQSLIPSDVEKRRWLFATLAGLLAKGDEELPVRLFSKRYLKSSKLFEQHVRSRLIALLRRYYRSDVDALQDTREDEQVLAEVGIELTHEDISFSGPMRFRITGSEELDAGAFPTGLSLDTEVLSRMEIVALPVSRVLSIENKANYRQYIRTEQLPNELVIYLGGFHSPGKRRFLRKLREFLLTANHELLCFHHWSDLDYGGILITASLRESVWPEVVPWRMEPEWLHTYAEFVEPFPNDAYRQKLESLLRDERYWIFHPLISELLRVNGVLEQEAFLV